MLPLKFVRSLVLGEAIGSHPLNLNNNHLPHGDSDGDDGDNSIHQHLDAHRNETKRTRRRRKGNKISKSKTPLLLFLLNNELVSDTYRLASIARDIGMDLYPTPSLSHIIFAYPSSSPLPSSTSSSSSSSHPSSTWSSTSLSSSLWSLPNDAVPLPFPSLTTSSLSLLRSFVSLSKGLFKLVFMNSQSKESNLDHWSNWDCCTFSLFSRLTGERINTMEGFSRALAGMGWTLFKTKRNAPPVSGLARVSERNSVYLFRKVDSNGVRLRRGEVAGGSVAAECRVRELKLPQLDFGNAPLRILQYIILMTDDIFCLA